MNEQKLISKKDTLETMGISYGQLYRWKRKGLIPESWFIRRLKRELLIGSTGGANHREGGQET